jgi:truncated hemoglobin YjbI
MASLYEQIGESRIKDVIRDFYVRAFNDPIIGHFFFGKNHDELVEKQSQFAIALLGGPRNYSGRPLAPVHHGLGIRLPHFGRRQLLMAEVLKSHQIEQHLANGWLDLEDQLRPLIVDPGQASCSSPS